MHGRAVTKFHLITLEIVLFGYKKATDNCYHHSSWILGFLRDVKETLCLQFSSSKKVATSLVLRALWLLKEKDTTEQQAACLTMPV